MGARHSRGQHPDRITIGVDEMLKSTGKRGASLASEGRTCLPKTGADSQAPTPDRIVDLAYAFWQSKALLSAVELGVFTALAEGPLDLETLTARTGIHPRGARDFFDALAALGLLRRGAQGRYCNQPDTGQFLDRRKPTYIGALLEHLNARHFRNWSLLTQALRTGAPQSGALADGSYPALYSDGPERDVFLNGMSAGSLMAAKTLATTFPWDRYKTFVDIGTAQGCVPVVIARAHPHLTGGGFDLPAVEGAFRTYVEQHGLSHRLKFYPGDFFSDALPHADVIVMGRILHNWDHPTRPLLLQKAHQALAPGGALIVYDPLIDDGRKLPHGLLSSLNMLIETQGGSEYSGAECAQWMSDAGFCDIRIEPLGDMHSAVVGTRN
jgi:SAM-dependent methyltransferase